MKLIEEKLKEFFLQDITKELKSETFINWRIIGTIVNNNHLVDVNPLILKTDQTAWVEEFKIAIVNGGSSLIIAVSPECPEIYFTIPEEILDKLNETIPPSLSLDELNNEIINSFYGKFMDGKKYYSGFSPDNINTTTTTGVNDIFWDKIRKTYVIN